MSRRIVILTLAAVAAVHAALLYPLLTQQLVPVQEVNKRVIQGFVLATPQVNKTEEIKPLANKQVVKTSTPPKPEPEEETVQKPVEHPAPAAMEKPRKEIAEQVAEEMIETSAPEETVQERVAEPVETVTQTRPGNPADEVAITPPRIDDAGHLENPPPSYPRLSKRLREEGLVILELWVLEDGTASRVTVKTSSGYPRLDKAALAAVSKWRYTPATRNGEAVAYRYEQPIEFAMK